MTDLEPQTETPSTNTDTVPEDVQVAAEDAKRHAENVAETAAKAKSGKLSREQLVEKLKEAESSAYENSDKFTKLRRKLERL